MNKEEITKRVNDVLVDQLGVKLSDIKPETSLVQDLGADSLDQVETCMALEEEFGVEANDGEFEECQTVAQIVEFIEKKLACVQRDLS